MNKITSGERMLTNLAVEYERVADPRLPACSRKSNTLLETCCTIMDLKGVGISKATQVYGYVKSASGLSQNYYPERLGKLYVINAPWGFSGVWSIIKAWLDPVTVNKIHILGANYHKELLDQIPTENLPTIFGGTCECDEGCAFSDAGPWKEKEWTRPPKWAKNKKQATADDNVIHNEPGTTTEGDAQAPVGAKEPETHDATSKAPAT
jgi:hypothetical protein